MKEATKKGTWKRLTELDECSLKNVKRMYWIKTAINNGKNKMLKQTTVFLWKWMRNPQSTMNGMRDGNREMIQDRTSELY